ncbi:rRNA-processing protein and EBNA1-binding protein ebp2 [Lignoscripta atroalba]|nr:rRNA-processing protein and EBNA1-binding protein ebp2 [Lignoscripta atroalba]
MVKKSKLLAALDAHKGRDHKLEKQKKLQKEAEKRKQSKQIPDELAVGSIQGGGAESNNGVSQLNEESDGYESDESEAAPVTIDTSRIDDSDSGSDSDLDEEVVNGSIDAGSEEAEDEGIPLSDIEGLSEEEKADIIPHQRLTINNTSALLKAQKSIALPISKLPFSEHQTVTSATQTSIPDVNDDLGRELGFYKQCLDAATEARTLLKREGVPFSRPTDYFAEMVKSDEHMGKIKQKMTDEAANKKAAAEARKQRDLKKFGKQVQVAKLQERDKSKRETLDKINILKRKRKDADTGNAQEDDLFDVALEDATKPDRSARLEKNGAGGRTHVKRQKKDEKFGFGGKKRFSKSGDAVSSADIRGFSSKKMKGQKKGAQRLGKSRRAKT